MVTEAQFPFLAEKGHVVSLVGGGGKTTLLYALSEHCARRGWRVLAGTTTHIRQPKQNFAAADADVKALWAAGAFAVLGNVLSLPRGSTPQHESGQPFPLFRLSGRWRCDRFCRQTFSTFSL